VTSKKLGAILRSVPPATARGEPAEAPSAAPAEPEVPLQVLIPASVRKQLGLKAAEEGQSLRALVLRAIRSLGIAVSEAQIQGRRGRRNS
jgi:hypothetical protein